MFDDDDNTSDISSNREETHKDKLIRLIKLMPCKLRMKLYI